MSPNLNLSGHEFFIGQSKRTNVEGIRFLSRTFPNYRVTPIYIESFSSAVLHLKSACSMCGPDHIIVGGELGKLIANVVECASPHKYRITKVVDSEAANCIFVNNVLIRRTREEFPESADDLDALGGNQILIRVSELSKVDGALTCCSVLF